MNKQRETTDGLRRSLMEESGPAEYLVGETGVARDLLADLIPRQYLNPNLSEDEWDLTTTKFRFIRLWN